MHRTNERGFGRSGLAIAVAFVGMLVVANPAAADWWVTYNLTGSLLTNAGGIPQADPLLDTYQTPVWTDGTTTAAGGPTATTATKNGVSQTVGAVTYADAPTMTKNQIMLRFHEDSGEGAGIAGIQSGEITVIFWDYYLELHTIIDPTPGMPGSGDEIDLMNGINDTTLRGGIGRLEGTTVPAWGSSSVGLVHNEILCENDPGAMICGGLGLPPDLEMSITQDPKNRLQIDIAGQFKGDTAPDSTSMVFTNSFADVDFEATLQPNDPDEPLFDRQYFDLHGDVSSSIYTAEGESPVPAMGDWQLVFLGMGLMGMAIVVLMRNRAGSMI